MSRHVKPWTFEPFEMDEQQTWTIYDENMARIVAIFYDEDEARDYLFWRNKKQAKKKARRADAAKKLAALGWSSGGIPDDDDDDDGRC